MNTNSIKACQQCNIALPYRQPSGQMPHSDAIQIIPGSHPVTLTVLMNVVCMIGGHVLNRQYLKALVMLMAGTLVTAFTGGIGLLAFFVMTTVDAYQIASRLNRGEVVGQWQCF